MFSQNFAQPAYLVGKDDNGDTKQNLKKKKEKREADVVPHLTTLK